jgi:NACalpha-BTF3-like transcription factor
LSEEEEEEEWEEEEEELYMSTSWMELVTARVEASREAEAGAMSGVGGKVPDDVGCLLVFLGFLASLESGL